MGDFFERVKGTADTGLGVRVHEDAVAFSGPNVMAGYTGAPRQARRKITSIHTLRGITIAAIVFRHCLFIFDVRSMKTSVLAQVVDELFFNWTVFFVLISGYLFQHLSYKYETGAYWTSKLRNVICPYVAVSLVSFPLLHYGTLRALPVFSFEGESQLAWMFRMLVTGQHSPPMWYIPMISVIFFMGPLLHRLSRKDLTVPAILGLLWAVITYKPEPWNTLLNVVHYLPIYIVGMFVCQRREEVVRQIQMNIMVISVFFLVLMSVSFHEKYELHAINQSGGYLMSVENIVLFALCFYALEQRRLPAWVEKLLSYLADISFSVYLIHMIMVYAVLKVLVPLSWWPAVTNSPSGLISSLANLVFTACVLLLCACATEAVKRLAAGRSRLLVGA